MNDFKSTWLMIKQHKVTGLKYFCKTALYDPVTYLGSGTYWGRHLAEHGLLLTHFGINYLMTKKKL